jgi:polyferredoxin
MKAPIKKRWEYRALSWLLSIYILFGLIIAGMNYGFAPGAGEDAARIVERVWHFYENGFKTLLIIMAAWLSWRLSDGKQTHLLLNLRALTLTAVFLHVIAPVVLSSQEVYFYSMPIPWTSLPLRMWGQTGLGVLVAFYLVYTFFVLIGTLLVGRKLQCSMLCMFNGFAAVIFEPVFPLWGRRHKITDGMKKYFGWARWFMFGLSLVLFLVQLLVLSGVKIPVANILVTIEILKYLSLELLMAMLLWVVLHGRGYCFYCPLGTLLAWLAGKAGQRIVTDKNICVACGKCNSVCPMGIDIMGKAERKTNLIDSTCVGCGRCVDVCPARTLAYETNFLTWVKSPG